LIAEDVTGREVHERRIRDPDGYRPSRCARCGESVLHIHDYRERQLRAEPDVPVITIVRHVCSHCEAIWQTLPVFVARHLWRSWLVVEHSVMGSAPRSWPAVALRTRQRWAERMRSAARFLIQLLAISGGHLWTAIASELGSSASRADLLDRYAHCATAPVGHRLASLSALAYRLAPKVRFM
jgi:hypothetical protein